MCSPRRTERIHYPWDDDGLGSDHFPHEIRRKYRRLIGSSYEERCESGRIGLTANELTWVTGSEGSNPSLSARRPGPVPGTSACVWSASARVFRALRWWRGSAWCEESV